MRFTRRLIPVTVVAMAAVAGGAFFAAASSAGPPAGKTLVELDTNVAPDLDPDGAAPADPGFMTAEVNMFDTLVNYPTKLVNGVYVPSYQVSQTGYAPSLATSYTHSGNTWTFNLRTGVKSCAGNTFTSADVVYTFARAKSVSGLQPIAGFVGIVGGLFTPAIYGTNAAAKKLSGEVKALGPYKVQFTTHGPNPLFPAILTTWLGAPFDSKEMRAHATAKDPWSHGWTNTGGTAGFGPYCLQSWNKGASETFVVNPNYNWGAKPVYTKVAVDQVPSDAQRLAGLISGSANIASALTPAEYQRAAGLSNLSLLSWDNSANSYSLGINYKYPPFNNPAKTKLLRQAIAYALPYGAINQEVFFGKMKQAEGEFPAGDTDYVAVGAYKQNLAKAKALMAQAGYPNGKGLPANSPAFKLTYVAERSSTLQPLANLIRTALAQIGITVTLNPLPSVQEQLGETHNFNLGMFIRDSSSRALVADVGYATLLYFAPAKIGGLSPSVNYDNPTVDSLYLASSKETGAARQKTLAKLQKIVMGDLSLIPLGSVTSQLAITKGITGWYPNTYDIAYWQYLK